MNETIGRLDQLVSTLATWGDFKTAWSPAAALVDAKLQADVTALLETYPFLASDEGYVEFLRRYGGAILVRADALVLSLYGFSHDIGMHIVEGPGEPLDDGALILCDMVVPRTIRARTDPRETVATVAVGFGFEATGERRAGIYRFVDGGKAAWYCETFLDWLAAVVARDGQVSD